MRLQTCIKAIVSILLASFLCLSKETAFISLNGDCRYPAVASESSTVYLAWLYTDGKIIHMKFQRSTDEGLEWSEAQTISNENAFCYPPSIAVNSGTVHLAWIDYGETMDGELYYSRSFDGGKTWEKNRILVTDANSARYPLLVCKEKHVYIVWQDVENKTYFMASHDQGKTWSESTILAKLGANSCYCYPPAISSCQNEVSVIWTDVHEDTRGFMLALKGFPLFRKGKDLISNVVWRKSADCGSTWNQEQIVTKSILAKETKEEIDNPLMMLSDNSQAYLFWLERRNNKLGEIYFAGFNPDADKLPITGKKLFTPEKRSTKRPAVVFDGKRNFHCAWASFLGKNSIINYGQNDAIGKVVIEKKELTSDTARYQSPVITRTPSGFLHVFWFDDPAEGWSRIFLKTSRDNGLTWNDWGS